MAGDILDLEPLLKPVAADKPAGESVRYDGVYDTIKEARREDDALPMGEWQTDAKTADWSAVINLCAETIATRSKDLQLAAWLAEALAKRHGFAGLRESFTLIRELLERYWDGLYPEVEENDLEFRAGPLNWLNEKLPAYIHAIALTGGDPAYSWNDWDESRKVDNLGRQNPEAMQSAIGEGKITGEQFDKAVAATSREIYEALFGELEQAANELSQLERVVDEKFGRAAPSLIKVRGAIGDCHTLLSAFVKKKREQDPSYKAPVEAQPLARAADAAANSRAAPPGAGVSWAGEPGSREEAFERLAVIAAYLKRVEPQHPVSYLLERAVRWTRMPLEEWLGEVVSNQDVLNQLRETLGIKPPEAT
jgi:type VI secretion system protein ImpA